MEVDIPDVYINVLIAGSTFEKILCNVKPYCAVFVHCEENEYIRLGALLQRECKDCPDMDAVMEIHNPRNTDIIKRLRR